MSNKEHDAALTQLRTRDAAGPERRGQQVVAGPGRLGLAQAGAQALQLLGLQRACHVLLAHPLGPPDACVKSVV